MSRGKGKSRSRKAYFWNGGFLAGLEIDPWGSTYAVMCGAFVAAPYSGVHLNPALSIGLALARTFPWTYVPAYIIAQLAGGFL